MALSNALPITDPSTANRSGADLPTAQRRAGPGGRGYDELLATLSHGSVHKNFDPYLDIDWDSEDFTIHREDPRWILSAETDPLGATAWYRGLPQDRQIEIGRKRSANSIKVGSAFESILIRLMMHYVMTLPNGSPEFRYCLHEMTEECHHIQMFQELVNRIGDDVPGMRRHFRFLSPLVGVLGGYLPIVGFIGILGGEEPIDHYQKSLIRAGADMPPAVRRVMQIHIAEEARHISFAGEFLRTHMGRMGRGQRSVCAVVFPLTMRWLAGEIMTPSRSFAESLGIPPEVRREAFWRSGTSQAILASYFGDMRALAEDLGLMNPVSRRMWRLCGIDGRAARYRGEPERPARPAA